MHVCTGRAAFWGVMLVVASCSDAGPPAPVLPPPPPPLFSAAATAALPPVRISELHYDNAGTDAGEAIEVSGPAGTDLTGWSIVLYNGATGVVYDTDALSGTIPATCDPRGVVVLTYPVNGIQNGGPDGIALVDAGAAVVEFLSYEGAFTGVGGPADGMTSTDIGASQSGSEPVGSSLQRDGAGTWSATSPLGTNTFGACNDEDEVPPAEVARVTVSPAEATIFEGATQAFTAAAFDAADQPIAGVAFTWSSEPPGVAAVNTAGVATGLAPGDAEIGATAPNGVVGMAALHVDEAPPPALPETRFSEIHYDNTGTDAGEAIEVEGPAGTDLTGWSVVLYNGNGGAAYGTRALSGVIPALCDGRGVVFLTYPVNGIQNGDPDGFALVDASGQIVEFLSYEGTLTAVDGPAAGLLSTSIGVAEGAATPLGHSLQRDAAGAWAAPAPASFGGCNGGPPPPPPGNTLTIVGRSPTADPPLPVGFEDQLFAALLAPDGDTIPTTITWTSETPAIARIDAGGVVRALGAGTALLRATADDADGTTATLSLPTREALASTTAQYAGNAEFGEPADGDGSDDFIVRRAQYTASYNHLRGIPNWVSYALEASHFGAEDRCDCFTFDPALPAEFPSYTTADYTGAGAAAGFGIDRGHLARSFDRTAGSLDNATTFYFTNIIPQAADLNQGPWADLESVLGDLARSQDKEVYIVTGPAGDRGTVRNEGKITIPASAWKVAVIMPRNRGLAHVHSHRDLDVVAVIMPNEPGVREVNWETYKTTVDAVEALSGYDLLALLPDHVELAVESGTVPPTLVNVPAAATVCERTALTFDADATDADVPAQTLTFGLMGAPAGATIDPTTGAFSWTAAELQDGVHTFTVVVTDDGDPALSAEQAVTITVLEANVAPELLVAFPAEAIVGDPVTGIATATDADLVGGEPNARTFSLAGTVPAGASIHPVTGVFTWTPALLQDGEHRITVRVTDDGPETACGTGALSAEQTITITVNKRTFLLALDADAVDKGKAPNHFTDADVNEAFAGLGQRTQLAGFVARAGATIVLPSGEVGDEGWFALRVVPASWAAAGPTGDGVRNLLLAGPGLGGPPDREALLDKVPEVTPLRAMGLTLLEGHQACAVVWKSDVSIDYGPLMGSLKGDTRGIVAFEILDVTQFGTRSTLPRVTVRVRDAAEVCAEPLNLLADAPTPISSSRPRDVVP